MYEVNTLELGFHRACSLNQHAFRKYVEPCYRYTEVISLCLDSFKLRAEQRCSKYHACSLLFYWFAIEPSTSALDVVVLTTTSPRPICTLPSCAQHYGGGWWYDCCHRGNLNGGTYYHGHQTHYADGLSWYPWHGYDQSMKATTMMIKRI